jgi:Flp pilus assembly protein TadB
MAQTKRKRQTKHRGNAAGGIETRGRTGRPPSADEKKRAQRDSRREERLNRKPTWKSAGQRALLAGGFMFLFLLLLGPKSKDRLVSSVLYAVVAMLLYVLLGYYLETFLWRRRMAKKAASRR